MKKIHFLLAAALCIFSLQAIAQTGTDGPQWLAELCTENKGLIDSISQYNAHPDAPGYSTYIVYYNQPLSHSNPDGPHFPLRALITVNTNNDPTKAVNHVYCSGYSIEANKLASPDSLFANTIEHCSTEIAHRYNANYILIEHRYFQFSAPEKCWENLEPLTAEEAAADFHNLFEALKKVFKGKWVMSGVSKGGITTLIQHTFYPEDMDIYVPYSAPFFDTDRDTEMNNYWYTHGWSKEWLDQFMAIRKAGLKGLCDQPSSTNPIWPIYYKMNYAGNTSQARTDSLYATYLSNISYFGFNEHAYWDTAALRFQMQINDSIIRSNGWTGYNDTVIAYMIDRDSFSLNALQSYVDTLRKYPDENRAPVRHHVRHHTYAPFGITAEEWWGTDTARTGDAAAYGYQSKRELGYHTSNFSLIADTPEEAEEFNRFYTKTVVCARDHSSPFYASLSFSPDLYNRVMEATRNATKPIILIYGEDDTWTGAAVKDEYVNNANVQKYILPAQNHSARFTSNTNIMMSTLITSALDEVLGQPQGFIGTQSDKVQCTKVMRNGQIYIIRGGKTYSVTGQSIE